MRNSKAKKIMGRKEEILQRRTSRERIKAHEDVKQMATGQLTGLGEPVTVPYATHTAVNVHNSYKHYKRQVK